MESMKFLLALAFSGLLMASPLSAQTVGESLPPWTLGVLDIHQIHTGGGNVALLIFPDGTSLLVDAGDGNPEPPRGATRAPDRSRRPGEWIARYAHRMLAHDPEPAIDYAFITHFHGDHMGRIYPESKDSAAGDYKLTGVTDVAEHIPIRMMLDRGWPDYDYPRPLDNPMMHNYHAFLEASRVRHGMKVARFQPGRSDQIVLKREPNRYASFEVRNIAANGEVWTGVAAMTRQHFPPLADTPAEDWPTENQCSMAIRVSYGSFDYYTGGDMPGQPRPGYPLWHDIETAVAEAVGAVDAAVLNHHGIGDGTTESCVGFVRGCGSSPRERLDTRTAGCSIDCTRRGSIPVPAMSSRSRCRKPRDKSSANHSQDSRASRATSCSAWPSTATATLWSFSTTRPKLTP